MSFERPVSQVEPVLCPKRATSQPNSMQRTLDAIDGSQVMSDLPFWNHIEKKRLLSRFSAW